MYIDGHQYQDAFESIKRTSLSHSTCKLVMFVSATDTDALCSARMLASLFKSELIPHKTVPIVGYTELTEMFDALDDDIVNVICIGCGANVDLETQFDIVDDGEGGNDKANKRKVYVIDNHRPWNLDNLFGSEQVVCLVEPDLEDQLVEEKMAYEQMRAEEEQEDEEEGSIASDSEDDGDMSELRRDTLDDEDDGNENEIDDFEENKENRENIMTDDLHSRKQLRQERKERKRVRQKNQETLEDYYSKGSYLSQTSTVQVYELLDRSGNNSVYCLWLAIIGITAVGHQNPQIYAEHLPVMKDEVARWCPQTNGNGQMNHTIASDDNSLFVDTDYAFFLLRHWSLYDAMIHSSYMSARLSLWTEEGRKRLHKMLAKMGISLQESREQWAHMRIDIKRTLREKLAGVTGPFGIEQVIREGIIRRHGFKGQVSASDAVEAIEALLQGPIEFAAVQEELIGSEKEKFWVNNFWSGWDALTDTNKLFEGIDRAKAMQKIITATGTALIEKKIIKDLHPYRLAIISDGPDIGLFRNPLALARLGEWVAEGCLALFKRPLPLVIGVLDAISGTYLVLGMPPRTSYEDDLDIGSVTYNQFGRAFQETANRVQAKVKLDAFESSIIEIARDDLKRFLEVLLTSGQRLHL